MQQIQSLPGYRVNEYLLVLQPNEELERKIRGIKEEFAEKYKAEQARWSRPHITLVSFVQYEMMEARLLSRLKMVAMGSPAFKVELKDYGTFPSHTLYINVVSKVPIGQLVKTIRSESQRLMKLNDDHKPHFIMEPHVTVARKLAPWQYEKAALEYSHRQFTGRFIADGMLLLKRRVGEKPYQIAGRLAFQNLPVLSVQGALF
ncbi:MAG: 2'-5' RNA ligase family protein [Chitinophagaceae bacterium]|nr:2'-5' RNA ligase family protein [Chitinophagaceae bacterium]MCW5929451.1 2'-5' RNA ligase family protein [Chitinophagaceae bacterium]